MTAAAKPKGSQTVAILMACAVAAPMVVAAEGWVNRAYKDPVGIPTSCVGHTGGVTLGKVYTDEECEALLTDDLVKHGAAIAACLPANVPVKTRAAFTSFGFNIGAAKFCGSTLADKAQRGDLAGACAELSRWVYAGGKPLPGLVARRAKERALCEEGLRP